MKEAFGSASDEPIAIVRDQAVALYRRCLTNAIQEGEIIPEQEALLTWLQGEAGLSDADIRQDRQLLEKAKRLAAYRRGDLPIVQTTKLLEGGESCHYHTKCIFHYQTSKRHMNAEGDLLVTSKRIVFASPTKAVRFSPSKILDIALAGRAISIQTEASQGSGAYVVDDPATLEAIVFGIVRKHKYLLAENYSSAKHRHIPDDVKRAVWDRDRRALREMRLHAGIWNTITTSPSREGAPIRWVTCACFAGDATSRKATESDGSVSILPPGARLIA